MRGERLERRGGCLLGLVLGGEVKGEGIDIELDLEAGSGYSGESEA